MQTLIAAQGQDLDKLHFDKLFLGQFLFQPSLILSTECFRKHFSMTYVIQIIDSRIQHIFVMDL